MAEPLDLCGRYWPIPALAEDLGCHQFNVYWWIRDGQLTPSVKIGRIYLIADEEYQNFKQRRLGDVTQDQRRGPNLY